MEYEVRAKWDPEAAVWIATSEDIPGLVLESGSLDVLMERVKNAIPELLELNGISSLDIPFSIISDRHDQIQFHG